MNHKQIIYQVGLLPGMVYDGTAEYFRKKGFTSAMLLAGDSISYSQERTKLAVLGYTELILNIEQVIWAQGVQKDTPIRQFSSQLEMWRDAGWKVVSSEGGREGDNDYFFSKGLQYQWENCDQCGIWHTNDHTHPNTLFTSWETFYMSQVDSIKQGVSEAASKGKPNGILLGVWFPNNNMRTEEDDLSGHGTPTGAKYKALLDWSYENSTPITRIVVWFGGGNTFQMYSAVGLDKIIDDIQVEYPPGTPELPPKKSLDELLGHVKETIAPAYIVWPLIGIWDDKGNTRLALEQKRIESVEKLWEQSERNKNKIKADKLEIREQGDVYYFENGTWYTEGTGWCKY